MNATNYVVDADGHVFEPAGLWTDRMDPNRWGDWIPRREVIDDAYEVHWCGGVIRGGGKALQDQMAAAVGLTPKQFHDLMQSLRVEGGHDPQARLADMDAEGIDAAVLYPSTAMFFGPSDPIEALHDIDFVTDCIRAYNDWISEFCAAAPDRLFGVAAVPLQDVDRAVAEAARARDELGLAAVFIRPSPYLDELPLNHRAYDPFWSACAQLGLAVGLHPGVHIDTPGACAKFGLVTASENMMVTNMGPALDPSVGGSARGQAVGNLVDMAVTLGSMLMGGVCERHPDLRLLVLESGGGWIPTLLQRMDEQVEAFPLEGQLLTMKPSEYFARQCWVSFEPDEWNLAACAQRLGTDRVVWASDYPHPEYHPGVVGEVSDAVATLGPADRRRVLGQNALDAYGLGRA